MCVCVITDKIVTDGERAQASGMDVVVVSSDSSTECEGEPHQKLRRVNEQQDSANDAAHPAIIKGV